MARRCCSIGNWRGVCEALHRDVRYMLAHLSAYICRIRHAACDIEEKRGAAMVMILYNLFICEIQHIAFCKSMMAISSSLSIIFMPANISENASPRKYNVSEISSVNLLLNNDICRPNFHYESPLQRCCRYRRGRGLCGRWQRAVCCADACGTGGGILLADNHSMPDHAYSLYVALSRNLYRGVNEQNESRASGGRYMSQQRVAAM